MIIGLVFWIFTLSACGFAAAWGGKDGKWAATLILAASMLTIPAIRLGSKWNITELFVLAVDLALLAGLLVLALRSTRYFPIWMAGFHLVAVLTHLSTLMAPDFTPKIYRALGSMWALPVTLSLAWGILLDLRSQAKTANPAITPN